MFFDIICVRLLQTSWNRLVFIDHFNQSITLLRRRRAYAPVALLLCKEALNSEEEWDRMDLPMYNHLQVINAESHCLKESRTTERTIEED